MGLGTGSGCRDPPEDWEDSVPVVRPPLAFKLEHFKTFLLFSDRSYDLSDEMNVNTVYYNANKAFERYLQFPVVKCFVALPQTPGVRVASVSHLGDGGNSRNSQQRTVCFLKLY